MSHQLICKHLLRHNYMILRSLYHKVELPLVIATAIASGHMMKELQHLFKEVLRLNTIKGSNITGRKIKLRFVL